MTKVVKAAGQPSSFAGRFSCLFPVAYPIAQIQLFVIPSNLNVKSTLFTPAGQDSRIGAQILEANNLKAGTALGAVLTGQPGLAAEQSSTNQS